MKIIIFHELGYIGSNNKVYDDINAKYGRENWSRAHYFDSSVISYDETLRLYEDSYYKFFLEKPAILDWLINTASEIYDLHPSNINSGLDYQKQECNAVHLQDITIRRVLGRLNKYFKGDHLVEIRGKNSEGYILNPGQVPFVEPDKIIDSSNNSWWKKGSIEHFYQDNKILLVDSDGIILKPELKNVKGVYFKYNKKEYYFKPHRENFLYKKKGRDIRRIFNKNRKNFKVIKEDFTSISKFLLSSNNN